MLTMRTLVMKMTTGKTVTPGMKTIMATMSLTSTISGVDLRDPLVSAGCGGRGCGSGGGYAGCGDDGENVCFDHAGHYHELHDHDSEENAGEVDDVVVDDDDEEDLERMEDDDEVAIE